MWWAVIATWESLLGLSIICPVERVSHGLVVVSNEPAQLVNQIINGFEVASANNFSHHDAEKRLDLIEPRTMFGKIHEPNPMRRIGQKRATRRLIFQNTVLAFFFPMAR